MYLKTYCLPCISRPCMVLLGHVLVCSSKLLRQSAFPSQFKRLESVISTSTWCQNGIFQVSFGLFAKNLCMYIPHVIYSMLKSIFCNGHLISKLWFWLLFDLILVSESQKVDLWRISEVICIWPNIDWRYKLKEVNQISISEPKLKF